MVEVINKLVAEYRKIKWPSDLQTANLRRLDAYYRKRLQVPAFSNKPYHPAACLNLDWRQDTIWVNIDEAKDKFVAEALIPYPPGIPLLWPGDKLNQDDIELFKSLIHHEINVHGTRLIGDEIKVPILKSATENFSSTLEY